MRRVEDQRFLTGRARYVDDIQLPHMLHGAVVMSPHAHARIRGIDTKALVLPVDPDRNEAGAVLILREDEAQPILDQVR